MNDGTLILPKNNSEIKSADKRQQIRVLHHASIDIATPYTASFGDNHDDDNQRQLRHSPELTQSNILKFLVLGAAGAGKTSILRRFFSNKFDWDRMPTLGSDFYSTKLRFEMTTGQSPHSNDKRSHAVQISVQMWDTPGKERYVVNSKRKHSFAASSITESFFMHADAIMLVYDMTSSTSFKQLLKWYADLMEIYQKEEQDKLRKTPPILVCANKQDLFEARSLTNDDARHRSRVQQRDVFGFERNVRGHDFQYEYQICPSISSQIESSLNIGGSGTANRYLHQKKRRMEISSYLANRENWTSDGSYLESLLDSEDVSHPDREMVLLWCLRNGLSHFEVSAATGDGVNQLVEKLIELALNARDESLQQLPVDIPLNENIDGQIKLSQKRHRNDSLDLHQRYSPPVEKCCVCHPQSLVNQILGCFNKLFNNDSTYSIAV
jgi:small GTP-binding protein